MSLIRIFFFGGDVGDVGDVGGEDGENGVDGVDGVDGAVVVEEEEEEEEVVGGVDVPVLPLLLVDDKNIFGIGIAHLNCVPSCVVMRRGRISERACSVFTSSSLHVSTPFGTTSITNFAPAPPSPVVDVVPVEPALPIEKMLALPNAARRASWSWEFVLADVVVLVYSRKRNSIDIITGVRWEE
jgi:hypothetical protein